MKARDQAHNFAVQYLRYKAQGQTHEQAWPVCDLAYNLNQSEAVRRATRKLIAKMNEEAMGR